MKWVVRIAANSLIGILAIFLFNYIGNYFGISLGINILNGFVVGILGVPGFALLLILQLLA